MPRLSPDAGCAGGEKDRVMHRKAAKPYFAARSARRASARSTNMRPV